MRKLTLEEKAEGILELLQDSIKTALYERDQYNQVLYGTLLYNFHTKTNKKPSQETIQEIPITKKRESRG